MLMNTKVDIIEDEGEDNEMLYISLSQKIRIQTFTHGKKMESGFVGHCLFRVFILRLLNQDRKQ